MATSRNPAPLTAQQRRALETRQVSVALSAGAGCGKTFVLTQRFLSHLDPRHPEPARLEELIAITFTERAAREMRDRIRKALRARLLAAEGDEVAHWLSLLRMLQTARISTIHSFCAAFLRSHAVEAGLDPRFAVLDQALAATFLSNTIDDELRRQLADHNEALVELAVEFGLGRLRTMIGSLLSGRTQINFDDWRSQSADAVVERWGVYHRDVALPKMLERLATAPESVELLHLLRDHEPSHPVMQDRRKVLLDLLPELTKSDSPQDDLAKLLDSARVQSGGTAKHWPDPEVYERVKTLLADLRERIKELCPLLVWNVAAARPAAVAGLRLLEVTEPIAAQYARRKQARGLLDFDDLLIAARDLLQRPDQAELRRRLAARIALLLVDEFQDTDQVQVDLIRALCDGEPGGGKLFFVGDAKQSIYRFRGADPGVFHGLCEQIPAEGQLPLTTNFRSQPAILDFVNALFCEELGPEYQPLRAHREQVAPLPAIEFLWAPGEEGTKETTDQLRRREADWIARRLRQLLDAKAPLVYERAEDQPTARPVRPGDIAILFRALSDVEFYEAALRHWGLEYYLVGGRAFYAQQEVFDLLNLLRAVASPADEVSLAGVLRSPFFSLPDEALYWLAQHPDGLAAALFDGVLPAELVGKDRDRVQFAARVLSQLRARKDQVSVTEFLTEALERTGYDAILLAEFLGDRKLANLQKLIGLARDFDRSGVFTLADFIAQLAEFVAKQPVEAPAATQPEETDVVRLMTIHQSKGLEFPVVVIPDLERGTRQSSSEGVAFHPQLGPLVRMPAGSETDTCLSGFELHAPFELEQDVAELWRLLYVATTRAADYLLLSSGVARLGTARSVWTRLLAKRFDLETGDFLGVRPPGWTIPQVRVTTTQPTIDAQVATTPRRPNLIELVERVERAASQAQVAVPATVEPLAPDSGARRQFSFSRLSASINAEASGESEAEELSRDGAPYTAGQASSGTQTGRAGSGTQHVEPGQSVDYDPLEFGTLAHAVLAELGTGQRLEVAARVRHYADILRIDSPAAVSDAVRLIERFLEGPRADAIASARAIHTELEFLLAWPPGTPDQAGRFFEGFIDCLYQDAQGRWHVVDYKTNRVTAEGVPRAAAAYEMQMLVYGLAVEQVRGEPPASLLLHFLYPGVEYAFRLDAAGRRRALELVGPAIESVLAPRTSPSCS